MLFCYKKFIFNKVPDSAGTEKIRDSGSHWWEFHSTIYIYMYRLLTAATIRRLARRRFTPRWTMTWTCPALTRTSAPARVIRLRWSPIIATSRGTRRWKKLVTSSICTFLVLLYINLLRECDDLLIKVDSQKERFVWSVSLWLVPIFVYILLWE